MNTTWEGPRIARPEEFAEAMRFTDRVFRPGQSGRRIVQRQYPHAYREQPAWARRLLLLRDAGQLVGCLAIHPLTLRLGAARLRAGGIGIVGTDPERRGEGIMSTLLTDAIGRMRRAGHAVSVLGGDRQRYARFGWENGGVRNAFQITARSLGAAPPAAPGTTIRRWPARPDAALCRRVLRLTAARSFGVERAAGDIEPLLGRKGKETWTAQVGRRFAYAVAGGVNREPRPYTEIHELAGDPQLCVALMRHLLPRAAAGHLRALAGPNPEEVALLQPLSAAEERAADGMIQVLSVEALCTQLQPELQARAAAHGVDGSFDLEVACVDGQTQRGRLELAPRARGRRRPRAQRLRLDQRQLVTLVFGALPVPEIRAAVGLPEAASRVLDAVLPVPLHIPSLNHI